MTHAWIEQLPWHEVVAAGIRTTGTGPFEEDLFWQFLIGERLIELPGGMISGDALSEIGARLPGLDYARVIAATTSAQDRWFAVWERGRTAPLDGDALAERFVQLIGRLGGDATAAVAIAGQLLARWSEPWRRYHDTAHLVACLHELDAARAVGAGDAGSAHELDAAREIAAGDADRVELALWYHDAIYEPAAGDCEPRSAALLVEDAAVLALPPEAARVSAALVRATAHATIAPSGDLIVELMIDIDLAILGGNPLRFMDYEYSIEEEYAAVPERAFRAGRGRFLAAMLARPRLFRTPMFHAHEARARAQITALLASPRYQPYVEAA